LGAFFFPFLAALFLADLLAAFWGVAWAEAAWTGAAAALLVDLLADFLPPFLEILLEAPDFLVDFLDLLAPVALALAINKLDDHEVKESKDICLKFQSCHEMVNALAILKDLMNTNKLSSRQLRFKGGQTIHRKEEELTHCYLWVVDDLVIIVTLGFYIVKN